MRLVNTIYDKGQREIAESRWLGTWAGDDDDYASRHCHVSSRYRAAVLEAILITHMAQLWVETALDYRNAAVWAGIAKFIGGIITSSCRVSRWSVKTVAEIWRFNRHLPEIAQIGPVVFVRYRQLNAVAPVFGSAFILNHRVTRKRCHW